MAGEIWPRAISRNVGVFFVCVAEALANHGFLPAGANDVKFLASAA